jgi:predicted nucleotidyltransferase
VDGGHDPAYSRAPEPDDVVRICQALNDAGARYVLIGGFAVMAHGGGRYTKDIDLLIDDAPFNVARVRRALSVLPDNAAADIADTDIREFVVIRDRDAH